MMSIYTSDLLSDTVKSGKCKKCGKNVVFAQKRKDEKWTILEPFVSDKDAPYETVLVHFTNCFPNGYRFKYNDKIIYAPFKQPEKGIYQIIGVDPYNHNYILMNLKTKGRPVNNLIYFVDKDAIPCDEASELLFV